jgi:hypothetical protein
MANAQNQVITDQAANEALLAELLGSVGDDLGDDGRSNEIIESLLVGEIGDIAAGGSVELDAELLDTVEADAARTSDMMDMYATQPVQKASSDEVPPSTTSELAVAPKKKRSGGKKKEVAPAAAEAEPIEAAASEPAVPKAPRATSVTHNPGDLLLAKLGEKADDWLVFDSNASLEQIQVDKACFIDRMNNRDAIADKVREKINMFMVWMVKGGTLNEVLKRAITVLHQDGQLTSGDKGNLQLNLLSKPYSVGTARSQANQMFMALPELQLTIKERGRMVPNPNSPLLIGAYAALGLA